MVRAGHGRMAMSSRWRRILFVVCIWILAVVVWVDRFHGGGVRQEISQHAEWGLEGWKYHGRSFLVVNVVDGDTLDIDKADGKYDHTRVRLLGMDTPETKSPKVAAMYYGAEATAYTKGLAEGSEVTILLDTVSDVRDMYGRLLAYVRLGDGRMLNEELIRAGCAYADLRFAHSEYEKYAALQEEAMAAGAGLWKEVERDELPKWLQRERPDLLSGE